MAFTNVLRVKDVASWEHSARVGLKNVDVGRYTHIDDPRAWFYIGFMHDVGKTLTDSGSLKKASGFGPADKRELDKHVVDGARMVRGKFNFTAAGLIWHHYFSGGYPSKRMMPDLGVEFSEATELKAMYLGRLTGVVDFYDAITSRKNDKFSTDGSPCLPSREQAREIMVKCNPDQRYFIGQLYDSGIFE